MASAQGQFPLKCQLCETETNIQWKCLDCDLLMCDKCKEKIHPKFKKASQHNIITIKDIGLDSGDSKDRKRDFSEIDCKEHKAQRCVMFCKECDQLVCPICIAKVHKKHDLLVIEEAFEIKFKNFEVTQARIENQKEDLEKDLEALDNMKATELSQADKTKQDILQQKQHSNNAVDQYASNLVCQVDDQWKITEQSIDKERNRILHLHNQLKEKASKIDFIKHQDTGIFMDEANNLEKFKLDLEPVIFPHSGRQEFVPGEITQTNFGLLQRSMKFKKNDSNCQLSAVKEFKTETQIVSSILPITDKTMWICDSNGLQKIKVDGIHIKKLESYKEDVYDMALTMTNDLIISVINSKPKIMLAGGSRISTLNYDVEPYFARAVHVTKANDIIFGACKTKEDFDANGGGVVIVMNKIGHRKAQYEYDKNGKALFTLPYRITSTKEEILVVVDTISDEHNGRIVILENSNSLIYNGHPDINSKNHQFKPLAVQATSADNIVVSDMLNNTLHILDSYGNLLAYHNTMEAGIMGPYALGFIKPGHLFIGCSNPSISSDKAKMYEARMPEY